MQLSGSQPQLNEIKTKANEIMHAERNITPEFHDLTRGYCACYQNTKSYRNNGPDPYLTKSSLSYHITKQNDPALMEQNTRHNYLQNLRVIRR